MNRLDFSRFEEEEGLFDRTYNGVPYWQMLRFTACEGAYSDRVEKNHVIHVKKRSQRVFRYILKTIMLALKSAWTFHELQASDIVCFTDANKKVPESRFFDYWEMPKEIKSLTIRDAIDADFLEWNDTHTLMVPYAISQVNKFFFRFFKPAYRDTKERDFLTQLERKLRERFGRSMSAQRMEDEILNWIPVDKSFERYAEKFFNKVKPKAIAVVCYYQGHMQAFYRVAKRRGIKIVEFQHGVVNFHHEYWFDDQRGVNNFTPDYFLAFGQQHINWTKMLPTTVAIPVGFPYQEVMLQKYKTVNTDDKMIVIYPKLSAHFEEMMCRFANQAVQRGYKIYVKLNPGYCDDVGRWYPAFSKNKNVTIITKQEEGIYYWLKSAKHHVMDNTTVGLEAMRLKSARVYIAQTVPHEFLEDLLRWNVAHGFDDEEQLIELIESNEPIDENMRKEVEAKLWQVNARENVQNFFSQLIAEKQRLVLRLQLGN